MVLSLKLEHMQTNVLHRLRASTQTTGFLPYFRDKSGSNSAQSSWLMVYQLCSPKGRLGFQSCYRSRLEFWFTGSVLAAAHPMAEDGPGVAFCSSSCSDPCPECKCTTAVRTHACRMYEISLLRPTRDGYLQLIMTRFSGHQLSNCQKTMFDARTEAKIHTVCCVTWLCQTTLLCA